MKRVFYIALFLFITSTAAAQSTLTFRVDMRMQTLDRTFNPAEHSIAITGNQLPFSDTRIIVLESEHPQDHIYVAKIHFPSIVNGQKLAYTFLIKKKYEKIEERSPRTFLLGAGDRTLPLVRFNESVL